LESTRIHPETRIGCVRLKVANIERSLGSYREAFGFEATQRYGEDAVFLSAGRYHHHIAPNAWAGRNVPPDPRESPGLFHHAILYPERREIVRAFGMLLDAEHPLDGASDHGISEALYLRDPDDNGVELYRDRSREAWNHHGEGNSAMVTQPLDGAVRGG